MTATGWNKQWSLHFSLVQLNYLINEFTPQVMYLPSDWLLFYLYPTAFSTQTGTIAELKIILTILVVPCR